MAIGEKTLISARVRLEKNIIGYLESLLIKTKEKIQIFGH